jgi:hypothetical protein
LSVDNHVAGDINPSGEVVQSFGWNSAYDGDENALVSAREEVEDIFFRGVIFDRFKDASDVRDILAHVGSGVQVQQTFISVERLGDIELEFTHFVALW